MYRPGREDACAGNRAPQAQPGTDGMGGHTQAPHSQSTGPPGRWRMIQIKPCKCGCRHPGPSVSTDLGNGEEEQASNFCCDNTFSFPQPGARQRSRHPDASSILSHSWSSCVFLTHSHPQICQKPTEVPSPYFLPLRPSVQVSESQKMLLCKNRAHSPTNHNCFIPPSHLLSAV